MELFHHLVGTGSQNITWWQMCIRAVVIFVYLLALIRLGGKRAFGKITSFDIVLGILLGSVLSRALTGNARLLSSMAASAVLVALHSLIAIAAYHSDAVGALVKGRRTVLMEDGEMLRDAMRHASVTPRDLAEAARGQGIDDLDDVDSAFLERNGDISIVTRPVARASH